MISQNDQVRTTLAVGTVALALSADSILKNYLEWLGEDTLWIWLPGYFAVMYILLTMMELMYGFTDRFKWIRDVVPVASKIMFYDCMVYSYFFAIFVYLVQSVIKSISVEDYSTLIFLVLISLFTIGFIIIGHRVKKFYAKGHFE